jgi:hypothetical protein
MALGHAWEPFCAHGGAMSPTGGNACRRCHVVTSEMCDPYQPREPKAHSFMLSQRYCITLGSIVNACRSISMSSVLLCPLINAVAMGLSCGVAMCLGMLGGMK